MHLRGSGQVPRLCQRRQVEQLSTTQISWLNISYAVKRLATFSVWWETLLEETWGTSMSSREMKALKGVQPVNHGHREPGRSGLADSASVGRPRRAWFWR